LGENERGNIERREREGQSGKRREIKK